MEEGGHVIGKRYEGPPWPLLNSELMFVADTFCNYPTPHQLIHCPHLAVLIHEWAPGCIALHAPPCCQVATNSFPTRAIVWKAKLPVTVWYISMASEFSDKVSLNLHSICPCLLFISIWRCHVATTMVSHGSTIVLSINFPVSFRQINSQTDNSKSIIRLFTKTDAPNWNTVSPQSPPTTT